MASHIIAVVGAGPKAAALAAKAQVLSKLGRGDVKITIVERFEPAANWCGNHGFTDGAGLLGTPPEKDVGFPYRSVYGSEADVEMLRYSWAAYQISLSGLSDWVDRGRKHPRHEVWSRYIAWVISEAQAEVVIGEVGEIQSAGGRVQLRVRTETGPRELEADGVVVTGPGDPIHFGETPQSNNILDGRSYWLEIPIFEKMRHGKIAIVGGGETAASIVLSLISISAVHQSALKIELINRHGTIYTRGESFHENRVFTQSLHWSAVPVRQPEERRDGATDPPGQRDSH